MLRANTTYSSKRRLSVQERFGQPPYIPRMSFPYEPRGGCLSKKGLDDLLTFQGCLSHTSLGQAPYSAQNIMIKVVYHKPFPNNDYKEQVYVTSIAVMKVTFESSELLNNRSSC